MRPVAFPLILLLSAVSFGAAQQPTAAPKIRVQLAVSASGGLEDRIRSYFSRELRKIADVEIVDSTPLLRLSVVALSNRNEAGTETGYTVSVVVTSLDDRAIMLALATLLPEAQRKFLEQNLSKQGALVDHLVYTVPPARLPDICAQIVAEIDGSHIESARKDVKAMIDMINAPSTRSAEPLPVATRVQTPQPKTFEPQDVLGALGVGAVAALLGWLLFWLPRRYTARRQSAPSQQSVWRRALSPAVTALKVILLLSVLSGIRMHDVDFATRLQATLLLAAFLGIAGFVGVYIIALAICAATQRPDQTLQPTGGRSNV
jgi:hypothetical protein